MASGDRFDRSRLIRTVDVLLSDPGTLHDLYRSKLSREEIGAEVCKFVPMVAHFVDKYIEGRNVPPPPPPPDVDGGAATPKNNSRYFNKAPPSWQGTIDSIVDIEENIWSPRFGIKGKVDMTVRLRGQERPVPLELKTGRSSFSAEHKGQVQLYSMMMMDLPDDSAGVPLTPAAVAASDGLLVYLRDCSVQQVATGVRERQGLVQLRNQLVSNLTAEPLESATPDGFKEALLPPRIDRRQACSGCPLLVPCTLYEKAESPESAPESISHLPESHRQYFERWSLMLRLESAEAVRRSKRSLKDLWCDPAWRRELDGACVTRLRVESCVESQLRTSDMDRYLATLVVTTPGAAGVEAPAGLELQKGDGVVVSTERRIAVATGSVLQVDHDDSGRLRIQVATDQDLSKRSPESALFTMDKLEYQGGQSLLYANLGRLMADDPRSARLRQLVIDRRTPTFQKGLPKSVATVAKRALAGLNKLQQKAVLKVRPFFFIFYIFLYFYIILYFLFYFLFYFILFYYIYIYIYIILFYILLVPV